MGEVSSTSEMALDITAMAIRQCSEDGGAAAGFAAPALVHGDFAGAGLVFGLAHQEHQRQQSHE